MNNSESRKRSTFQNTFIALVIIGILLYGWFFFWGNDTEITNYPPQGDTIVAIGDSLVEGHGDRGRDGGFVGDLEDRLDVEIKNLGVSGETSEDVLDRMDDIVSNEPDIAILLVGGNDYLKKVDKEITRQNIAQIIEILQQEGVVVILLGVRGGVLNDGFSEMYESLADRYGTYYVSDVLDGLLGNTELMADRIHPNSEGYEHIADRIEPLLADLLKVAGSKRRN